MSATTPAAGTDDATATATPLLELEDVHAGYGPFKALFGVSLRVPEGGAVALLGPNGAGKTTVARVATGLVEPVQGQVRFAGEDVTGQPPWKLAQHGIAHAVEGRSVFSTLTVEENLLLTFRALLDADGAAAALDRAYEAFPRLGERRAQVAGTLSGGEQRMLSLARVLANPPRVLVVDELSLGLAPIIVDEVFQTLQRIRDEGTAILVVEQMVDRALGFADEAVLLAKGQVVEAGPVDELRDAASRLVPGAE